jgi:hypothetical protein
MNSVNIGLNSSTPGQNPLSHSLNTNHSFPIMAKRFILILVGPCFPIVTSVCAQTVSFDRIRLEP